MTNKTTILIALVALAAIITPPAEAIQTQTIYEDTSVFTSPEQPEIMADTIRKNVKKTLGAITKSNWSKQEKKYGRRLAKGMGNLLITGNRISGMKITNQQHVGTNQSSNIDFYRGTFKKRGILYCWEASAAFANEPFYIVRFKIEICDRERPIIPTPTPTPTPSVTPAPTPTPSPTATPQPTPSPTPTVSPTPSPTPTATPMPTPTPTVSPTPTATPSATPTPTSTPTPTPGCVETKTFWKRNFPDAWCVTEIRLGNRTYTAFEALQIMTTPAGNNGLVFLAENLIGAELNLRCLNSDPSCIEAEVAAAHAMIGDLWIPPIGNDFLPFHQTCPLARVLRQYNQGELCAPRCPDAEPQPSVPPCPERPLTPIDLDQLYIGGRTE